MDNKEFVSYEQAVALREIGFDEYAFNWYSTNAHPTLIEGIFLSINPPEPLYSSEMHKIGIWKIKAPLKQQCLRWFREKYDAHIHPSRLMRNIYVVRYGDWDSEAFTTYEEAENACIDKLLELSKQQDK